LLFTFRVRPADFMHPAHLRNAVFVCLDGLLIVSDSLEEHLKVLSKLAGCIKSAGLTLNVKSKFCMKSVNYLGHIVG